MYNVFKRYALFAFFLLLLIGCGGEEAEPFSAESNTLPARADLEQGWNQLLPAGNTACATDTPYSFFVRESSPEKLLLYFEGGGGCWDSNTCDPNGFGAAYTPFVDASDEPNAAGIFDFENPDNPFADYSVVFVPYCTGDLHLGDGTQSYNKSDGSTLTIQHNGYNNSMSAINWMFENYEQPETVFVSGSSAGAIPSPFYATFVAAQYPDTRIEQLGDAGGAYRAKTGVLLYPIWGSASALAQMPRADEVADVMKGETFEELYIAAAQLYPNATFSQFNTEADSLQAAFLSMVRAEGWDAPGSLADKIAANYADIESADSDNFIGFIGEGSSHVILDNNSFYRSSIRGVPLHEWVGAIAEGAEVSLMNCDLCIETGDR